MKTIHTTIGILSITIFFMLTSCMNSEKRKDRADNHVADDTRLSVLDNIDKTINEQTDLILTTYLYIKDALVNDDSKIAAEAGRELVKQFKDFNAESYAQIDQQELMKIIEDATEHAQQISMNGIVLQREHFDMLSKNMIDLIALTGTSKKLYQVHCPMYNNNKGAQWLSASKEIQNPYFGSEMMKCGEIVKEIN
ncbi:MAG: DUF3347 domain-containing protein [Candidatus Saccharimonadaceae bacterium]